MLKIEGDMRLTWCHDVMVTGWQDDRTTGWQDASQAIDRLVYIFVHNMTIKMFTTSKSPTSKEMYTRTQFAQDQGGYFPRIKVDKKDSLNMNWSRYRK